MRRLRALAASELGAAALEFAFVAPPFLALLIGMLQSFVIFFAQRQLDETVSQSSRAILIGQAATLTASQYKTLLCQNNAAVFDCTKFMVNVQNYGSYSTATAATPTLTFDAHGHVTNNWAYNPGNSGDVIVLQVMYQWPVVLGPLGMTLANLPNGNRLLVSTYVFKREPV